MHDAIAPIALPGCAHDRLPRLSIVVALTNGVEQIRRCLESIAMVGEEIGDCQTIVVLNNPTAEVRVFFERYVSCDEVIDSPTNLGTTVSWQLAFNRARAEHVLLLHEDAAARPGAVGALLDAMAANPDAGCIGPLLAETPGDEPANAGWIHWRENLESKLGAADIGERSASGPYPVDAISSAFSLWDRDAWVSFGGFDERRFPAIGLDLVACCSTWSSGRSVLVDPATVCDHHSGAMNTREGPLSGKPVRFFLIEELRGFWNETWSHADRDYVSLRERGLPDAPDAAALAAGLANAAERRASAPVTRPELVFAQRPITDPSGVGERPTDVSEELLSRVRELERHVVERYHQWLIAQHDMLSDRLREATTEGARLFESRAQIMAELDQRNAEVERLNALLTDLQSPADSR